MELSDTQIRSYGARVKRAKLRVLCTNGFYGELLSYLKTSLDSACDTAYTDGVRIAFSPAFLDELSDSELDFVLTHEILHVALRHCERGERYVPEIFNIAADIVVNSNILRSADMKCSSITLKRFGESMHTAPDGKEGYLYSAEEVYAMLIAQAKAEKRREAANNIGSDGESEKNGKTEKNKKGMRDKRGAYGKNGFDDHSRWGDEMSENSLLRDAWRERVYHAAKTADITGCGNVPAGVERILRGIENPRVDWRTLLNDFIQQEISDYSFCPPDRRFGDGDFFLPDFNDVDVRVENVLFMSDTSASISDQMLNAAFSEICGAIAQFNGNLRGNLGFFDAKVYDPVPFGGIEDLQKIRPRGGGGTSFHAVFRYLREKLLDDPPCCMVILTDGYCSFPPESDACGVPVLWLINNEKVTPPFGVVARMV